MQLADDQKLSDLNHDGKVTHDEAVTALHNPIVRERMAKAICKFPIEWTKNGIDERWGWLMSKHEAQPTVLTKDDFATLKAHIEAVAFWEEAKANDSTLPAWNDCWHLPPKAFIEHFRKCGWLSEGEMQQLLPTNTIRKAGLGYRWEALTALAPMKTFIQSSRRYLNNALRKYLIDTPFRIAAFFAQATVESSWFTSLQENGGTTPTLHKGWYGRGFLQLTNPGGELNNGNNNYYNYFRWRGRSPASASSAELLQWRDDVALRMDDATQSAGFYWIKNQFGANSPHVDETASYYADQFSPNVRVVVSTNAGDKAYYSNEAARKTAAIVNIPGAVHNAQRYSVNGLT